MSTVLGQEVNGQEYKVARLKLRVLVLSIWCLVEIVDQLTKSCN